MTIPKATVTTKDVLEELEGLLMEMPERQVREQLREQGLDYDKVAEAGANFFDELLREHKRSSWMSSGARMVNSTKAKLADLRARARQRALEWLEEDTPLPQGAFAGRQEAEITYEERLSLLEDLAMTELLEEMIAEQLREILRS